MFAARTRLFRNGFGLLEIVYILLVTGLLSLLGYILYQSFVSHVRAWALTSTVESVDSEASALAKTDSTATAQVVGQVLDRPANGFAPATYPDTWDQPAGTVTVTYDNRTGVYLFHAPGTPSVCYRPANRPGGASDIHHIVGNTC